MRVVSSLVRGLRILERIAGVRGGARVTDLAREFGIPSSNMTLFLNSLVQTGYVLKSVEDGRYYVSGKVAQLAKGVSSDPHADLKRVARGEMERLHDVFNENVLLAVLNGFQMRFVDHLQSTRNIQILNVDEKVFVPHVTAAGKAILAFLPEHRLARYFKDTKREKYTAKTETRKQRIEAALLRVRDCGVAVNRGEYESEIMAAAAPIFRGETVVASLVVQFPVFRYGEDDLAKHAPAVKAAAQRVSDALGSVHS